MTLSRLLSFVLSGGYGGVYFLCLNFTLGRGLWIIAFQRLGRLCLGRGAGAVDDAVGSLAGGPWPGVLFFNQSLFFPLSCVSRVVAIRRAANGRSGTICTSNYEAYGPPNRTYLSKKKQDFPKFCKM